MLNHEEELKQALLAKNGDKEAFAYLYNIYVKKIYNFIYFKTLHQNVAEDLTSQVFLKALKNINKFKDNNFSAWIYTIARNTVIDHYRSTREIKNIDDCWDLSGPDSLTDDFDNNLKISQIRKAMNELSITNRELLIMRLWLDLPFKEIALILDKSESAVKMSFGRILNNLKKKVSPTLFLLISLSIICRKLN
jgi:RNA polymerase sigma-70 factor (ECF subfamily)